MKKSQEQAALQHNTKIRPRILIVDDDPNALELFSMQLYQEYEVETSLTVVDALRKLEQKRFHIALTDLVLPGENGLELIQKIKTQWPFVSVIVISGQATIETAVEAMKLGAEDFLVKPVRNLELINLMVQKILKTQWLVEENDRLNKLLQENLDGQKVIGTSVSIQSIINKVQKIAPLDTTVLITGETGVGKGLFAELLHKNSKRKEKEFVAVNCGSLSETLLESLLFGHKKGAFTDAIRDKMGYFMEANGGTLFLDEITETSLAFQVKLLKVLEKGAIRQVGGDRDYHVDVRVITATNKDIKQEVQNGNFREDLYYRLNIINIHIPPLRERREDIKLLSHEFVKEFSQKYTKQLTISKPVLSILDSRKWEGNIRELRNALEHAVILAEHSALVPEDLPEYIFAEEQAMSLDRLTQLPYPEAKQSFEKEYLIELLKNCRGNISMAADQSKIPRQNLYLKFSHYLLDPAEYRS
ncbi:MAG TPA: sigma-54 dependent transcriptional regulator [Candidatus Cloacimonadota bacterium]|nr:sigma-54 dependent transcriptional regulator [Candidatus Cloacimonadota bacterium]HPT73086.1 sigma-54 dependent transcriptional regulator [Candidatus Cloacimonadota bacterium]